MNTDGAIYVLPMYSEVDPIHLGVHRQYSRGTQGAGRRYAGATSLPTIPECIYETEHLASVMLTKATIFQWFT